MARILVIFGTRPEAIKMFPLVAALRDRPGLTTMVAVTAQHRAMLDQVLTIANLVPDWDLDLMTPGQSLDQLTARALTGLGPVLDEARPDGVVVHGDTLTTLVASLAACFRKIPVAHVEAGLRSGNRHEPWPEEINRTLVGHIADLHFAPTQAAADALLRENIPADRVFITGNTVIDALFATRDHIRANPSIAARATALADRFQGRRIVTVTTHRRENFGAGIVNIAAAVRDLCAREDVAFVLPVHPNPEVAGIIHAALGGLPAVALVEPLDYPNFVALLDRSHIVLTDSGGVQEEAPSLGKPVLVMRDTTERPEGLAAGTARLVGADRRRIGDAVAELLDSPAIYAAMSEAHNPFGDGFAASRIARIIDDHHNPRHAN